MHIIRTVARNTCIAHGGDILAFGSYCGVTALASYFPVRPFKLVFGFGIVVETPDGPSPGVVACFTSQAQLLFVLVFFFMTRKAISGRVFVTQCFVAPFAGRVHMPPGQREARQAMVKVCTLP